MAKWLKNGKSEKEIIQADEEVKKTVEKILQDVAKLPEFISGPDSCTVAFKSKSS